MGRVRACSVLAWPAGGRRCRRGRRHLSPCAASSEWRVSEAKGEEKKIACTSYNHGGRDRRRGAPLRVRPREGCGRAPSRPMAHMRACARMCFDRAPARCRRPAVGRGKLELRMCEGSTTSDLLAALAQQHPALAAVLPSCALSVNRRYLSTEQVRRASSCEHSARGCAGAALTRVSCAGRGGPRPAVALAAHALGCAFGRRRDRRDPASERRVGARTARGVPALAGVAKEGDD